MCQDAREVVGTVCEALGVDWTDVSIEGDPTLQAQFAEEIPVVMVDGIQRDFWKIDAQRLRTILEAAIA